VLNRQSIWPGLLLSLALSAGVRAVPAQTDDRASAGIISESVAVPPADTLRAIPDTTTAEASRSGIDTIVTYTATDSIVYTPASKVMDLFGKGEIQYRTIGLKAELIAVNWNTSVLTARGVVDTSDTSTGGYRGRPDLIDGGETYKGNVISYNFRTKKGKIDFAESEIGEGYYYGEKIKKIDTDVLFVRDGKYTSCDLPHPHYYFGSPEMKVVLNDKVVARPVYLYISDVPVFALPFGVFPNERGRRSGIITPVYGEDVRGRFLERLGYYWAINDYADLSMRASGYTGGSWRLDSDFRYALRYNFTGSVGGFFEKRILGERGDPGYSNTRQFSLAFRHNHELDPTTRLDVDFTFASSSAYQSPTSSIDNRLRQDIRSNATLQKRWDGTPHSMTINVSRYQQNLPDNKVRVDYDNLPSVSFSRQQTYPFRSSTGTEGTRAFYEQIAFSYSGQLRNALLSVPVAGAVNEFNLEERRGVRHSVPINASAKVGFFSLTPFFNYTELWYDRSIRREFDPSDSSLTENEIRAIKAVRYFDTGISTSTKLYGIVQPNIFGIKAIRHQVTPSLTYTYRPDFSKPSYGYYGTYVDQTGTTRSYSFYEKGIFGGAPGGEQQSIGVSIGNVFEMKTEATDTTGEEKKYRLLNATAGISYNLAADSLRFSEIRLNFNTTIGDRLNMSGGGSFNLYKFVRDDNNPLTGRRVNRFLLNEEGRLAQLTSFNFSISTQFSGEKKETRAGPIQTAEDSLAREYRSGYSGVYDQTLPDFSIPWQLDLTWNYSQNQSNPYNVFRSSTIAARLSFNLTEFWKIEASTSYDIVNRNFVIPQITVYRDLHCWEMNFYWEPIGPFRSYRIEIRLKAPDLHDVKVTKTDRSGSF
jgi:lipopolysaccharide assembly outer membrane protein LptD (OstA)